MEILFLILMMLFCIAGTKTFVDGINEGSWEKIVSGFAVFGVSLLFFVKLLASISS